MLGLNEMIQSHLPFFGHDHTHDVGVEHCDHHVSNFSEFLGSKKASLSTSFTEVPKAATKHEEGGNSILGLFKGKKVSETQNDASVANGGSKKSSDGPSKPIENGHENKGTKTGTAKQDSDLKTPNAEDTKNHDTEAGAPSKSGPKKGTGKSTQEDNKEDGGESDDI